MITNIIMPQGGQDLETGTVVRWLIKEGDAVKRGAVVCEVETEKAVFEVSAPADGYLRKILVPEGVEARVFAPIAVIGALEDALPGEAAKAPAPVAPATVGAPAPTVVGPAVQPGERGGKIRISPKAKRMAHDLGVSFERLVGSGPLGRIVAKDILAAKATPPAAPTPTVAQPPAVTPAAPAPQPVVVAVAAAPSVVEQVAVAPSVPSAIPAVLKVDASLPGKVLPLNKVRKVIAQRMQVSKQFIPHFYVTVAVDMTDALHFREKFNKRPALAKEDMLSVNDLLVRACALTLKEFPQVNSSVLDEQNLILWEDIHIGIAVALDEGLVVPVLEHADWLNLSQIPRQTRRLITLAKEGKQASLASSRFTISNLGMFQVESFMAIINPPEAAILAVASVEKRVMPPAGDQLGLRLRDIMNMTLSLDHRIGDGVLAARFLNRVRELLEEPDLLA